MVSHLTPTSALERPMFAISLRFGSVLCFSIMNVLVKTASEHDIHLAEIVFWRQAFSLPLIVAFLWWSVGLKSVTTRRFGAHFKRTLIGLTCIALVFFSFSRLPLAEATTLGFVTPIFTTLLSIFLLNEKFDVRRGIAIFCGFIGVLIIIQPSGVHLDTLGLTAGLGAAVLVTLVYFHIRDLSRTDAATTIVFWFGVLSTVVMLPLLLFYGEQHDPKEWLLLIGIGSLGGVAQLAMTNSLRYAPVSSVVGIDYAGLIWSVLFGGILWSQIPSSNTFVGAIFIIGGCVYLTWRQHAKSP